MGDTQHSLRILRRSGRLRPATIATATLMIVAVLSLISLVSSPAFALSANAKAKLKIPHVPLAQVPWQRHFSHPTPIFIPPMSLPWTDYHVAALHNPNAGINNRHKWAGPDGHFIMAMCQDRQGNLWLATEGAGV
ncbi:MAG: two-component regulator propeller domain-containing protein, partial [Phycisphaerae bacterium]